jgi:hypothetical protein
MAVYIKKIAIITMIFIFNSTLFGAVATRGFTGIIDFPNAYTLRANNFNIGGAIDNINNEAVVGFMLETGFLTQLEAGIKISTDNTKINDSLLKSNIKFQFLPESKLPALAVGFVESDSESIYYGKNIINSSYGYVNMTKSINNFFDENFSKISLTCGLSYNENKDVNAFSGLEIPIYNNVKLLLEFYSYHKIEIGKEKRDFSLNVGTEFFTTEKLITKVFWRDINETFGIIISYIGIYR